MKENDWIVAGLNNPTFTNSDFDSIAGMTLNNTQMLSLDEYLKSDFIRNNQAFADDNGQFSEQKFTDYYNKRLQDFGEFQQGEFAKGPALDMFDIDRKPDSRIQDVHFSVHRGINPDRQAIGIEGINVWSDPVFSRREIAKQNKVFDTETGTFRDNTVNDHTLVKNPVEWFKDLFRDPLVLATWDEDGTHLDPLTGQMREHKKGEEKLNDKGTYYYETLGGRSALGKDVLSVFDTFTVDGQGINKYDFFDSNDIQKSITGTIVKNVVAVLPLFMGPIGTYYSAGLVLRNLAKAAPALYGIATSLLDVDMPAWMNTMSAIGERLTSSTSDYGKQNMYALENFGNLIGDVALQWGEQQVIAQGLGAMKTQNQIMQEAEKKAQALFIQKQPQFVGKEAELLTACRNKFLPEAEALAQKSTELSRNASMMYMAVLLNDGVYEEMLDHGASKTEAAAVTLGSILGTFAIDKAWHLGEIFFDEATPNAVKQARAALKNEYRGLRENFKNIASQNTTPQNKYLKYITKAYNTTRAAIGKFNEDLVYHTTNLSEKMIASGFQNAAEVLSSDVSKSLYELAGQFGFDTASKDVGSWDNAFDRYMMNFLGGAAGAGVFYGKTVWDTRGQRRPKVDQDLTTLIRNGHADDLRRQLQVLYDEGKTGSKELLAADPQEGENGQRIWRTTDDPKQSHAQAVVDMINNKINIIEEVLLANQANLTDDELFENMVLSEYRYKKYQDIAPITNYYADYATALDNLYKDEIAYRNAEGTIEGKVDGTSLSKLPDGFKWTDELREVRDTNLNRFREKRDQSRKTFQDFKSGNNSLDYVRKLNFAIDPILHTPFLEVTYDEYFNKQFPGKTEDSLTAEELIKFRYTDWPNYVNTELKAKLSDAYAKFKAFGDMVDPHLEALSQQVPEYKRWVGNIIGLFGKDSVLNDESIRRRYKNANSKLDDETDEDYENRNRKIINQNTGELETDEQFDQRQLTRFRAIDEYNENLDREVADRLKEELQKVGMQVDPQTARYLRKSLPGPSRVKDLINRKVGLGTQNAVLVPLLMSLKADLSNSQEIIETIPKVLKGQYDAQVDRMLDNISKMTVENEDGETMPLQQYLEESGDFQAPIGSILEDFENSLNGIEEAAFFTDLTEESKDKILNAIAELADYGLDGVEDLILYDIASGNYISGNFNEELTAMAETASKPLINDANAVIASISRNPLYQLQQSLKTTITNPISELIKQIAASNGDAFPEIESILQTVQDNFETIDDINQLQLDSVQSDNLAKAKHYLQLLGTYLYAASTVPSVNEPIGHNKTINYFAETHADKLTAPWAKLPEIDADYASILQGSIYNYIVDIDNWIQLSDKNSMNKAEQYIRIDTAMNRTLWDVMSTLPRTVVINGKNYDLLEGIEGLDSAQLTAENGKFAQVPIYNLERLFYNNIQRIAKEQKVSVAQLIQNSNIIETYIPGIKKLKYQMETPFDESLSKQNFTDYTKLLYLTTLLSDDPAKFFRTLKQSVATNEHIAPITVQEFTERIALASTEQSFRDIWSYAVSLTDTKELPFNPYITIIPGVAGAGKSTVIARTVDAKYKGQPVMVAAPTTTQAEALKNVLGRDKSMTFSELFKELLGEKQYNEIRAELDKPSNGYFRGTYYDIDEGADGLPKVKIHTDKISFNKIAEAPKAIYLDEATHLSTVEALILGEYGKSVGAQVLMLGDRAQRGYFNPNNQMSNIDEGSLFAIRTPNLTVSLRDNNLQKSANQKAVRALVDKLLDMRLYDTEENYIAFFPTIQNLYSTLNFKVYNGTELRGDVITDNLDNNLIQKLKAAADAGQSIAFIGDESSPQLKALINAGINITPENILNIDTMQGQEYDYVVTDHKFTVPSSTVDARIFLQDLYTLMTRSRSASIFVSDTLADTIGANIMAQHTAMAPSITDSVTRLRDLKREVLDKIETGTDDTPATADTSAEKATDKTAKAAAESPTPAEPQPNPEEDFKDPDDRVTDVLPKEVVQTITTEDASNIDETPVLPNIVNSDITGYFPIECYGDAVFTGAELVNDETAINRVKESLGDRGRNVEGPLWRVTVPAEGELRNLQVLAQAPEENILTYTDKITKQKALNAITSVIKGNLSWPTNAEEAGDFPFDIRQRFKQSDWEQGRFILEIRPVPETEAMPVHSPYKQQGLTYTLSDGRKVDAVASIVYAVRNKAGRLCKFDVASINNPDTFRANRQVIEDGLKRRIKSLPDGDAKKAQLQEMLNNLDSAITQYTSWFESKLTDFLDPTKGNEQLLETDVTNAVRHPNTTILRKRTGAPIRLGGRIDPNRIIGKVDMTAAEVSRSFMNLMDQSPDHVFSPVYTFASDEKAFDWLDQSLKGRTVVFTSGLTYLKPEKLIDIYLRQKANPTQNDPQVRMILLDNYGMTFSQLCNPEFANTFKTEGADRKPFRQNFTGIRMFTSLWNTRAALMKFNSALETWKSSHSLSDQQVETLLHIQDYQYRMDNGDTTVTQALIDSTLQGADLQVEALNYLAEFNEQTCKEIPMFRLGYSRNEHGFHIQEFDVSDSTMYDSRDTRDGKANLCVITLEKAGTYLKMLQEVFKPICPPENGSNMSSLATLGLTFKKVNTAADGAVTYTNWDPTEFIDLKDANHRRSLSGFLKIQDKVMTLRENDSQITYEPGSQWSVIPKLLASFTRTVLYYQMNPTEIANRNNLTTSVSYLKAGIAPGTATPTDYISLPMSVSNFFGDNGLLKPTVNGQIDTSLLDMLNLIFHGTVENIHGPYKKGQAPVMQMTDAYFKHGFETSADLWRKTKSAGDADIKTVQNGSGKVLFYEIGTPYELFTSDVDVRSVGLQLSLSELLNSTTTTITPGTPTTLGTNTDGDILIDGIKETDEGYLAMKKVLDNRGIAYSNPEQAIANYNSYAQNQMTQIFRMQETTPGNLETAVQNMIYQYRKVGDSVQGITYENWLRETYNATDVIVRDNGVWVAAQQNGTPIYMKVNFATGALDVISAEQYSSETHAVIPSLDAAINRNKFTDLLNPEDEKSTVFNALKQALQPGEYSEEIRENLGVTNEDLKALEDSFDSLWNQVSQAHGDDTMINEGLQQISNNDDLTYALVALSTVHPEIYNRLFESC